MKYLVLGAGAVGGCLAAHLTDAGKDVTLIARGENLQAIQANGLLIKTRHAQYTVPVRAVPEQAYTEHPDVVLVCVKSYHIDDIIPFLDRVCTEDTIVLPILNALYMGKTIASKMKRPATFMGGVAYIAAVREAPGIVRQKSLYYRVVFGPYGGEVTVKMRTVRQDMLDAGLAAEIVADPIHSALRKYFRVSTMSAVQAYYDCAIGAVRDDPERMGMLMQLADELLQIAEKRSTPFEDDVIGDMVNAVHSYAPDFKTSLKNDIDRGSPHVEYQTMFFDVYDLGRELGLEMPAYGKVSRKFGYKDKTSYT